MAGLDDKWQIYEDKRNEFRWRRTASNGEIVGKSSESYVKKADCKSNAQRHGMDANPKGLGQTDKWELYKDKRSEHRWRRRATNGEITGASSEGYVNKSDCKANAQRNGMA